MTRQKRTSREIEKQILTVLVLRRVRTVAGLAREPTFFKNAHVLFA
jgi:hypothetical protein